MKTDKELYKEFLNGNKESFETLVKSTRKGLIYYINGIVKNMYIAEEISQDVFVYVMINKEKYNMTTEFSTYLYMIGRSRAINYIKKESKKVDIEDYDALYSEETDLDEVVSEKEELEKARQAISKLPYEYRQAIYLANIRGLSYAKIGEILNKNISQTKALIFNARKRMEKLLKEEGMTDENR